MGMRTTSSLKFGSIIGFFIILTFSATVLAIKLIRDNGDFEDSSFRLETRYSEAGDNNLEVAVPLAILKREVRSLKDVNYELNHAEGRHKNRRQSYNYRSKPKRSKYNNHNRHSENHRGKGGYHKSDSYSSNSGYNTNSNYDRARRGDYGDSNHKEYGGRRGNSYGGKGHGGNSYGGRSGGSGGAHGGYGGHYQSGSAGNYHGSSGRNHYGGSGSKGGHHGEYGDDASSYLDAGGGY